MTGSEAFSHCQLKTYRHDTPAGRLFLFMTIESLCVLSIVMMMKALMIETEHLLDCYLSQECASLYCHY